MLNTVYQLKTPRQFDIVFQNLELDTGHVLIRPTYLSICNADQRYYQGIRPEAVLRQKLPMALIHEGVGRVVYDPTGAFPAGTDVVMIPNLPREEDPFAAENYLPTSRFRGSGTDGFLQEYISSDPDRLLALPQGLNPAVAAMTEFVSVACHAIRRFRQFSHGRRENIGVWGDGNLGYVTALLLRLMMPECRVTVFGVNRMKLAYFTFADACCLVNEVPEGTEVDHAFECVGGPAASRAINQMIDLIRPEGTMSILGVSEEPAPLNTRMILEKGLRLFGSSRSGRGDFREVIRLYEEHPELAEYLENLISAVIPVRGLPDLIGAFDADIHKMMGKTILRWDV